MSESTPAAPVREVDPQAASQLLDAGAVMLDVREPDEVAQGHAEGVLAIPLGLLGERLTEVPDDRQFVVVCRSGGRSLVAATALIAAGYEAVNLAGGMEAWRDAGFPVVRANGTPGVVA